MKRILFLALSAVAMLCSELHLAAEAPRRMNQTLGLAVKQTFFDTLQRDVIIPGIMNLQLLLNASIMEPWTIPLDLLKVNGNLTYVSGNGTDVDNDT
jgi:hypothetical protein